jgi:polyisoprenoid-binding protein YceI
MKQIASLRSFLVPALGFAVLGSATAAEWHVAEDQGSVGFTAVQQGTKFSGRFETFSAMIDIDPAAVESGHIVGVVETSSVNTRDHDRDASLNDRDWFDTASHPEARFESDSIARQDDGSYVATGQLTLKGKSRPIELSFTFDAQGSEAKFAGKMTVNRFDFDVGEGWNDTSWVGQDVEVRIDLPLTQ